MGCCQPKCRCENVLSAIEDTNTIDLTGNGSPGTPLKGDVILAPNVTQPLTGITLPNGITAGPFGLESQPVGQPGIFFGDLGVGSIPTIVADTAPGPGPAGSIAWGARLEYQITNYEPDRISLITEFRSYPGLAALLDPGALVEVYYTLYVAATNALPATMLPFFSNVLWRVNNTSPGGPSLQEFSAPRPGEYQFIGFGGPAQPVGDFQWRGIQMWIRTSGFGAGSVAGATFTGLGPAVEGITVPV